MKNTKIEKRILYIITFLLIILIIGTYFYAKYTEKERKNYVIQVDSLKLILDDNSVRTLTLKHNYPISDKKGFEEEPYIFSLENVGDTAIEYTIYLDDYLQKETVVPLDDQYVKYSLEINKSEPTTDLLKTIRNKTERILDRGIIESGATNTYKLKLWMDKNASKKMKNRYFSTRLRLVTEDD